jgi:hypothetical protein
MATMNNNENRRPFSNRASFTHLSLSHILTEDCQPVSFQDCSYGGTRVRGAITAGSQEQILGLGS